MSHQENRTENPARRTRIAVAGGTGLIGEMVVTAVATAGHEPVVIARSTGVNLITGDGLDAALSGVDSVIDVSNVSTLRRKTSVEFFTTATTQLLLAGDNAGVRHHVALSIVGVDRVMSGYYEGKRRQERLVLESPQPASVLRATQFHEFVPQVLGQVSGPIAIVPQMRTQPIAAREVADALLALALGHPVGMAPELAGPQVHEIVDLARLFLAQRQERRRVFGVRLPGSAGREMAYGGLLPTETGPRGVQTFGEWLQAGAMTPTPLH